jgi:quercetin dioxygenase-like cupin family protein
MSYFLSPDDRRAKEIFNGVTAKTWWGEKMLISLVDLPANSYVPEHSHPHEQAGIIVEGELTFTIGGESRKLKPGDMYIIPGGVLHSLQTGPAPGKAVDIFSPVREEYQYE